MIMMMMMISIKFPKMIHKINQDAHDIFVYSFFWPPSQIKIMRSVFWLFFVFYLVLMVIILIWHLLIILISADIMY